MPWISSTRADARTPSGEHAIPKLEGVVRSLATLTRLNRVPRPAPAHLAPSNPKADCDAGSIIAVIVDDPSRFGYSKSVMSRTADGARLSKSWGARLDKRQRAA